MRLPGLSLPNVPPVSRPASLPATLLEHVLPPNPAPPERPTIPPPTCGTLPPLPRGPNR